MHENKYDYSKVKYKDTATHIEIICPVECEVFGYHGSFNQTPNYHLSDKNGCSKCSRTYNYSTEEFIKAAKLIVIPYWEKDLKKYILKLLQQ